MILTKEQVLDICREPANLHCKEVAEEMQLEHRLHICPTKEQYKESLIRIIGYENEEQFGQKQELSQPVTKVLTKEVLSQQGRWKYLPASKVYEFKGSEEKSKEFQEQILSQVWNKQSMEFFMKTFFNKALYTDFNGFILIEQARIETYVDEESGVEAVYHISNGERIKPTNSTDKPKPYLIFKALADVKDYYIKGNAVQYIVLYFAKDEKTGEEWYRVIDDQYDYVVKKDTDGTYFIDETNYPVIKNELGYCPAKQVSNIQYDILDYQIKTSPIDACIPHLKLYLTQYANHVMTCLTHDFPVYYQVGSSCTYVSEAGVRCNLGKLNYDVNGSPTEIECPGCKGTGHNIYKDAASVIVMPAKDEEGKPFNLTNVAGYIEPPIAGIEHQVKELDWTEQKVYFAGTGIQGLTTDSIAKTATETMLNMKPLENIVSGIIDNVEEVETFLTDAIGKLYYGDSYERSQITYSRRLNLRDENTVSDEIKAAKANGSSFGYIKTLIEEQIYSRYQNSPIDLQRNLVLLELEPLPGFTFTDIKDDKILPNEIKVFKLMFNDLVAQWENVNGDVSKFVNKQANRGNAIMMVREQLDELLEEYLPEEPEEPAPI